MSDRQGWEPARASFPPLGPDAVHVWRVALDPARAASLAPLLSADERARAARFHFDADRHRWTVSRAALRTILAAHAGVAPGALRFVLGRHGKPALDATALPPDVGAPRFSLSHSGDVALVAVSRAFELGVDVERTRGDFGTLDIARRFFSPGEVEALAALPEARRTAAFFRCWASKEAFIKGTGHGLARALDSFDVEVDPARDAALLRTAPDASERGEWSLVALDPAPGYAGALAVRGRSWRLLTRDWLP